MKPLLGSPVNSGMEPKTMTPNEARQVLATYPRQAQRRDVLGLVARQEIKAAYMELARHAITIAGRMPAKRRAAYQEMAGFYRTAAAEIDTSRPTREPRQ